MARKFGASFIIIWSIGHGWFFGMNSSATSNGFNSENIVNHFLPESCFRNFDELSCIQSFNNSRSAAPLRLHTMHPRRLRTATADSWYFVWEDKIMHVVWAWDLSMFLCVFFWRHNFRMTLSLLDSEYSNTKTWGLFKGVWQWTSTGLATTPQPRCMGRKIPGLCCRSNWRSLALRSYSWPYCSHHVISHALLSPWEMIHMYYI